MISTWIKQCDEFLQKKDLKHASSTFATIMAKFNDCPQTALPQVINLCHTLVKQKLAKIIAGRLHANSTRLWGRIT